VQAEFASVQDGSVGEGEFRLGDAHVDHATAERGEFEAAAHRLVVAGGIDDQMGEFPVGKGFEVGESAVVPGGQDGVLDAHGGPAELEAGGDEGP
jgi:hypothetical protein